MALVKYQSTYKCDVTWCKNPNFQIFYTALVELSNYKCDVTWCKNPNFQIFYQTLLMMPARQLAQSMWVSKTVFWGVYHFCNINLKVICRYFKDIRFHRIPAFWNPKTFSASYLSMPVNREIKKQDGLEAKKESCGRQEARVAP